MQYLYIPRLLPVTTDITKYLNLKIVRIIVARPLVIKAPVLQMKDYNNVNVTRHIR